MSEEEILEQLCNALTESNGSQRFCWIKVQGEEDWEGALFDMEESKVYLVRIRNAEVKVTSSTEANS